MSLETSGIKSVRENPITWVGALGSIFLALAGAAGGYLLSLNDKVNDTMAKQKIQDYVISDVQATQKDMKNDVKEIKEILIYGNIRKGNPSGR